MVEGFHLVDMALERGCVKTLISLSPYKEELNNIEQIIVTEEILEKLSSTKTPQGIIAICKMDSFIKEVLGDKVLYLDVDMIVRHSLDSLWDTDINDYAIAAVPDMDEQSHIESNRLPYPMETGYFNAGMLLINVDLPEPEGPMILTNSPSYTLKLILCSASNSFGV